MYSSDAAAYRLHAAKCIEIAHRSSDPETRLALRHASNVAELTEQAMKNNETVLVYETPVLLSP